MTYVRDRLGRQLARAYRQWRHQTSGHLSGDRPGRVVHAGVDQAVLAGADPIQQPSRASASVTTTWTWVEVSSTETISASHLRLTRSRPRLRPRPPW
jgi:hypothetical protein